MWFLSAWPRCEKFYKNMQDLCTRWKMLYGLISNIWELRVVCYTYEPAIGGPCPVYEGTEAECWAEGWRFPFATLVVWVFSAAVGPARGTEMCWGVGVALAKRVCLGEQVWGSHVGTQGLCGGPSTLEVSGPGSGIPAFSSVTSTADPGGSMKVRMSCLLPFQVQVLPTGLGWVGVKMQPLVSPCPTYDSRLHNVYMRHYTNVSDGGKSGTSALCSLPPCHTCHLHKVICMVENPRWPAQAAANLGSLRSVHLHDACISKGLPHSYSLFFFILFVSMAAPFLSNVINYKYQSSS